MSVSPTDSTGSKSEAEASGSASAGYGRANKIRRLRDDESMGRSKTVRWERLKGKGNKTVAYPSPYPLPFCLSYGIVIVAEPDFQPENASVRNAYASHADGRMVRALTIVSNVTVIFFATGLELHWRQSWGGGPKLARLSRSAPSLHAAFAFTSPCRAVLRSEGPGRGCLFQRRQKLTVDASAQEAMSVPWGRSITGVRRRVTTPEALPDLPPAGHRCGRLAPPLKRLPRQS